MPSGNPGQCRRKHRFLRQASSIESKVTCMKWKAWANIKQRSDCSGAPLNRTKVFQSFPGISSVSPTFVWSLLTQILFEAVALCRHL
jgi:hypothetical protein